MLFGYNALIYHIQSGWHHQPDMKHNQIYHTDVGYGLTHNT